MCAFCHYRKEVGIHQRRSQSQQHRGNHKNGKIICQCKQYDRDSLQRLLQEVTRPEARELIMGTALQILSAETINAAEDRVLSLASETWNLEPTFLNFPEGDDDEPQGEGGEGGTALA